MSWLMNEVVSRLLSAHGLDAGSLRPSAVAAGVSFGRVAGDRALPLWRALRVAFPETGLWPVLCGDAEDDLDAQLYQMLSRGPAVAHGPAREVLAARFAERREKLADLVEIEIDLDEPSRALVDKVDGAGLYTFNGRPPATDPWPTEPPRLSFVTLKERGGAPVSLALLPIRAPHAAPAALAFAGGQDAPRPQLIGAVLADWQERFGAVPACITGAVIECHVDRPPQDQTAALDLAVEHWIFCEDIVGQGTQSLLALAQRLWRSPHWYFWWD
jgi:hypothetical protein